jgi:hypothetical protein
MKINHIRNKNLLEDVEDGGVIDVDQSVDKLADEITDAYAEGEGVLIPEENAENTAKEIKDAAKGIKTEIVYAPIVAKNRITEVLDFAFADASMDKASGIRPSANILIDGLPGSGKTAIVSDWAEAKGCNLVYVNAKNKDLDAFLNGYPVPVDNPSARSKKSVDQAYSAAINALDEPNSILFLDEFNRAPSDIRASLLTLINEHKVSGDTKKGYRYFKELLFSVACINPSIPTDEGAMPLNDAEKSRFTPGLSLIYDSNTKDAISYVRLRYKQRIEKIPKDLPKAQREMLFRKWSCAEHMLLFILSDRKFAFDDRKLDTLNSLASQDATMLNQRSLIEAIEKYAYMGKNFVIRMLSLNVGKDEPLEAKAFSHEKRSMLLEILMKYQDPQIDIPADFHKGVAEEDDAEDIENPNAKSGGGSGSGDMQEVETGSLGKQDVYGVGDLDDIDLDGGIEIDDGMFASITGGNKQPAVSEAEAKKRISEFNFS